MPMTVAVTLGCAPAACVASGTSPVIPPFSHTKVGGDEERGKHQVWTLSECAPVRHIPGEGRVCGVQRVHGLRAGAGGSEDEGEGAGHVGESLAARGGLAHSLGPGPMGKAWLLVHSCSSVGASPLAGIQGPSLWVGGTGSPVKTIPVTSQSALHSGTRGRLS